ncbi:MAG: hypothetical protein MHM6MM_001015 [Cercozoa sp. M6MM]
MSQRLVNKVGGPLRRVSASEWANLQRYQWVHMPTSAIIQERAAQLILQNQNAGKSFPRLHALAEMAGEYFASRSHPYGRTGPDSVVLLDANDKEMKKQYLDSGKLKCHSNDASHIEAEWTDQGTLRIRGELKHSQMLDTSTGDGYCVVQIHDAWPSLLSLNTLDTLAMRVRSATADPLVFSVSFGRVQAGEDDDSVLWSLPMAVCESGKWLDLYKNKAHTHYYTQGIDRITSDVDLSFLDSFALVFNRCEGPFELELSFLSMQSRRAAQINPFEGTEMQNELMQHGLTADEALMLDASIILERAPTNITDTLKQYNKRRGIDSEEVVELALPLAELTLPEKIALRHVLGGLTHNAAPALVDELVPLKPNDESFVGRVFQAFDERLRRYELRSGGSEATTVRRQQSERRARVERGEEMDDGLEHDEKQVVKIFGPPVDDPDSEALHTFIYRRTNFHVQQYMEHEIYATRRCPREWFMPALYVRRLAHYRALKEAMGGAVERAQAGLVPDIVLTPDGSAGFATKKFVERLSNGLFDTRDMLAQRAGVQTQAVPPDFLQVLGKDTELSIDENRPRGYLEADQDEGFEKKERAAIPE